MKKWIVVLALVLAMCSSCKTTHTSIREDIEQKHVTVYDTTRVITTVMVVDTAHTEYYHTSTTHTVEFFDTTTGQLSQRVIDQQSNIQMLQDQLLSLQAMLDSMRTMRADTSHVVTHEEIQEEVVEKRSWWEDICKAFIFATICITIILLLLWHIRMM